MASLGLAPPVLVSLQAAINPGGELGLGGGAYLLRDNRAVFKQDQRGDAADTVLCRNRSVLIHIELCDLQTTLVLGSDLFNDWADHFARTAPLCPEVHEDWQIRFQDFGLERRVGYSKDRLGHLSVFGVFIGAGSDNEPAVLSCFTWNSRLSEKKR